jgi:hypothetical protein
MEMVLVIEAQRKICEIGIMREFHPSWSATMSIPYPTWYNLALKVSYILPNIWLFDIHEFIFHMLVIIVCLEESISRVKLVEPREI